MNEVVGGHLPEALEGPGGHVEAVDVAHVLVEGEVTVDLWLIF